MEDMITKDGAKFSMETRLGYTIETVNNEIFTIQVPGDRRIFRVGQKVCASGKIFLKRGVEGTIVKIDDPFADILKSSDIFHVQFEGYECPHLMKSKDLI